MRCDRIQAILSSLYGSFLAGPAKDELARTCQREGEVNAQALRSLRGATWENRVVLPRCARGCMWVHTSGKSNIILNNAVGAANRLQQGRLSRKV